MDSSIANIIVALIGAIATISVAVITSRPKVAPTVAAGQPGRQAATWPGKTFAWTAVIVLYVAAANYFVGAVWFLLIPDRLESTYEVLIPLMIAAICLAAAIWGNRRILQRNLSQSN